MYFLTPFSLSAGSSLGVSSHEEPVLCVERGKAHFSPSSGLTCQPLAGAYVEKASGYIRDAGKGLCEYCQFSPGD